MSENPLDLGLTRPKPKILPEQLLAIADDSFAPAKRFVLFSGGNDSSTLLHWAWNNSPIQIDAAVHINTGIGVEETRDFARRFCFDLGIPLIEKHAPEGEYERLCREYGVPGPGMHWMPYRYLKDRQVASLVKEYRGKKEKGKPLPPVMLITGVRRDESVRRMGTTKPINLRGGQLWVAPLIDWSNADLIAYRESNAIPRNEVADVMHMSMECACGAYGSRSEFEMLRTFYPKTAAQITRCEAIARGAGQKYCVWGQPRSAKDRAHDNARLGQMDLCFTCNTRQAILDEAVLV